MALYYVKLDRQNLIQHNNKYIVIKRILSILFLLSITGCGLEFLATPIITGVLVWVQGEATKYYDYNADVVYRASKHALNKLELEIIEDKPTNRGYFIQADKFNISIEKVKPNITRLQVRVNIMGDKPYAELFYKEVDSEISSIYFDNDGKPTKSFRRRRANQTSN